MDNRFNTIAGWVLGAGIVALGGSILTGEMFHAERPGEDGLSDRGRVEDQARAAAAAEQPIAAYLASRRPGQGRAGVQEMRHLPHDRTRAAPTALGPNLWGTVGAPVAPCRRLRLLRRSEGARAAPGTGTR